ncbi:MAG TPA: DUF362 domain-containing protein [Methanomassiliicoccales archaeon]|jgi:uncharacterized protein (DUF362 family)/NAD-dependent dihydropyrimidine dehydrogenase PreA subunit
MQPEGADLKEPKQVALVACEGYGRDLALDAVKRSVDLIGGIGHFAKPGQRVLLKPNILMPSTADKCVVTHPDIVYAVAKLLVDNGCKVIIAESPGAGMVYSAANLRKAYEKVGYDQVAKDLGIELNEDVGARDVANPNGVLMKRLRLIEPVFNVDAVVVVSKMKTHLFTYMTGAAKNAFGLVPGMEKPTFHARLQRTEEFARMIVDINEFVKPTLEIMDAVDAMEGDGPQSGTPRHVGAILASGSYSALDVVASRIMSIDPTEICTIRAAVERGLLAEDLSDVEVIGEELDRFVVPDYQRPSTFMGRKRSGGRTMKAMMSLIKVYALRPSIVRSMCVGCGKCYRGCPMKAISMKDGKAKVDQSKCIRCYSCHEFCDSHAILLRRSLGGKAMAVFMERKK